MFSAKIGGKSFRIYHYDPDCFVLCNPVGAIEPLGVLVHLIVSAHGRKERYGT